MLYFDGVFGLVLLGVWLYCLFDVITTDPARCRNLPKLAWLAIVLLLPDVGSIAWLVAGHPWQSQPGRERHRAAGRQSPTSPDDDEAFLRGLRERAEQQRRDYQAQQELRAEQERQRRQPGEDG
jgi:hypothetical protein